MPAGVGAGGPGEMGEGVGCSRGPRTHPGEGAARSWALRGPAARCLDRPPAAPS